MRIMRLRNTFSKLITMTIAVAALALIGSSWMPGGGRTAAQHVKGFGGVTQAGFVPGQTLRVSLFNPNPPERGSASVRAQVRLCDATGNVLARSPEVELPPGQFRSFDFNRADLPLVGEPNTGRLQVRGQIYYLFADGSVSPDDFLASTEIIDNGTGKTLAAVVLASPLER